MTGKRYCNDAHLVENNITKIEEKLCSGKKKNKVGPYWKIITIPSSCDTKKPDDCTVWDQGIGPKGRRTQLAVGRN